MYNNISYKYKRFWFFLIKLAIVLGAGYFVYQQTFVKNPVSFTYLVTSIKQHLLKNNWILPLLFGFTIINWLLEIFKWETLMESVQKISFKTALVQSLSSHTLSLITPFKTGEYGGKALYYTKGKRKKIVLLNFVGNMAQLFATLLFGSIGAYYFVTTFEIDVHPRKLRFLGLLIAMLLFVVFSADKKIPYGKRGSFYQRALLFSSSISRSIKLKVVVLSLLRFVIFSHQFYYLLLLFDVEISYQVAILLIYTMYLFATFFPVMSLFDFVIKGSVAIYLFTFVGVDQIMIMTITTLMWLLNFAFPAVIGSYFVMRYKPPK